MSQKSYDNKPTVYLIPTPIGNLEDITLRSIKILGEVDIIFSEDTRETKKLLELLKINKKLITNNLINESKNIEKLIDYLNKGKNVGIVSDRGTPVISDPGFELVQAAIKNDYNVVSLPGTTALIPALTISGISAQPFLFYGFLNNKEKKRIGELEALKKEKATIIFYEAPHRITKTLENIFQVFGDRKVCVARELTKKFEEIYRGNLKEVIEETKNIKGEIVIVIEGNKENNNYENISIIEHINLYIKEGLTEKEAIKKVAKDRGVAKNIIYKEYHQKEVK
jgi:16S rRNA (cytidine1402-2'-O)-methyltransferase